MDTSTSRYPSLRGRSLSRRFKRRAPMVKRWARRRSQAGRLTGATSKGPFFLQTDTQHVKTFRVSREVGRAVLALGGLAAWAFVALLISA
jgi:hypothetical protein